MQCLHGIEDNFINILTHLDCTISGWIEVGCMLWYWSRGWYVRHFGTGRCIEMIKRAKHSRRYYGRTVPVVPNPAVFVRNQMVLQAITRKMIREGKAHNLHVQQALNSMPKQ